MAVRVDSVLRSGISSRIIVSWAKTAMKEIGRETDDLAILFVGSKKIKDLNAGYRGKDVPTDVLSFPADTKGDLGDIFICAPVAKIKAKTREMEYKSYVRLLVVHSVLHLVGYDHHSEKDSRKMEKMENKILKLV